MPSILIVCFSQFFVLGLQPFYVVEKFCAEYGNQYKYYGKQRQLVLDVYVFGYERTDKVRGEGYEAHEICGVLEVAYEREHEHGHGQCVVSENHYLIIVLVCVERAVYHCRREDGQGYEQLAFEIGGE